MTIPYTDGSVVADPPRPDRLAHVALRTRRFADVFAWWRNVLQADVVFDNGAIGFLAFDDEHHRIAVVQLPALEDSVPKTAGLDHVSFTYDRLADLVATYERLARDGIRPAWSVNHGPTLSLYYADPDGNQAELQVDRFATVAEATAFLQSTAFANHPIGHSVDFDDLARRFHDGEAEASLLTYRYDHENAEARR
jgi:catechol 2,3-dioxygenase-like lactoylglutathione lyase family enzyme